MILKQGQNTTDKILYLSHYAKKVNEGEEEPLTTGDIKCPGMLRAIADQDPSNAFVICWPKDGKEPTYHCSTSDIPTVLLRLQTFIHKFFNGEFDSE
jgi:hypothetical protein